MDFPLSLSTYFLFEKNVVEVATVAMRDQVVADYRDFFGKNCTDVEIELDHFLSCHKSQLRTKMITPKGRQSSVLREDSA